MPFRRVKLSFLDHFRNMKLIKHVLNIMGIDRPVFYSVLMFFGAHWPVSLNILYS